MCVIPWTLMKLFGAIRRAIARFPLGHLLRRLTDALPWKLKKRPEPQDQQTFPRTDENQGSAVSPISPTFALTIGIDRYLQAGSIIPNLSGCVADADEITSVLTETLRVPHTNITNLRNEQATAVGITTALKSLATNDRIPRGANIFIFYAGHGTEVSPPPSWPCNGQIQTLMPYDFDPGSGDEPIAKNALPDIMLSQLLENIANEKGSNITVVFDSCHSGSGTRHADGKFSLVSRGVKLPNATRLATDGFPTSRGSREDKSKALGSHVLLAACTELQQAYESNGRGMFTSALTNLLKSEDLRHLTHADVIRRLPALPGQNPQCEGINQNRIFLDNHTAGSRRAFYFIRHALGDVYDIDAGEAHGVTVGAQFAVYDDKTCINELGRLVVSETSAFQSSLRPVEGGQSFDTPQTGAFGILTRIGTTHDVRLFVQLSDELAGVFTAIARHMRTKSSHKPTFKVVNKREENPDLIVTASEDGTVRFEVTDKICRDVGLREISFRPTSDSATMSNVLRGVADFYWHFHCTTTREHIISPRIDFECYELIENDAMEPIGGNLLVDGSIQIDICSDDSKPYGFCIRNTSTIPLFISMFYFSMSDLSIDSYYQPPSAAHKGHFASLPAMGLLTIGYGSGGSQPHTFYLNEGQDVDVGYIKLFLSTEYVDYSHVPQESPFLPGGRAHGEVKPKQRVWDTMLIPIVQRRQISGGI